jgi:FRG domain
MEIDAKGSMGAPKTITPYGQWVGKFQSLSFEGKQIIVFPGNATFSIEPDLPNKGFACIDQGNQVHGSRKDFILRIEGDRLRAHGTSTTSYDWKTNEVISVEESVKRQGGHVIYLTELDVEDGIITNDSLTCNWIGNYQGNIIRGNFIGTKLSQNNPSPPNILMNWEEFKIHIASIIKDGREFFFRGQSTNKHRLNSSFHRERRYDLLRYATNDCEQLVQHVNAVSGRQYNLKDASEFGALLSLAQHHGFPTPLLDWSKSPYIAAFFAFENRSKHHGDRDNPRVYIFDAAKWQTETTQVCNLADPRPSITPREFIPSNNPRHLPQQSVHTYSNIEDIEGWIRRIEKQCGRQYLTIIDIERSQRRFAMKDLAYMGVTAAALFPGLDGVCGALKERFFELS